MNSHSKIYTDPCHQKHDDDCEPSRKFHEEHPAFIKCGGLGGGAIASGSTGTVTVSSLALDTSKLCNPTTKLEFASTVAFNPGYIASGATGTTTLTFQVNKLCRNMTQKFPVGPGWTYNRTFAPTTGGLTITTTDTFSFFVCDCGLCSDECCNYTVDVTPATGSFGATIANASLSAIVVSGDNNSSCGC